MGGLMTDGCVVIWTVFLLSSVMGYKPVIIVHGILDGPRQFEILAKFINQSHPGTNVTTLALYDYTGSMKPLWQQVDGFREAIRPIMESTDDGVHLICFSQGGLICRGVLATLPTHNAHSLILLSSPLAGQYGDSSYLKYFFPTFIKSRLYHFCYTTCGQRISICNYWNGKWMCHKSMFCISFDSQHILLCLFIPSVDPHQRERYLNSSIYLALLNGEIEHANSTAWRDSFLRIQTLVLIGGQDDGVITPWESSIFGFYDSNETVVEMEKQDWYLRDAFGLKTLNSEGAVVKCVVRGVHHTSWHSNHTVYKNCIDKWLT
ncbi:lysosomal thioesterase PPT2-like isoform X1 [Sinocyclocheilus grahami]|uniref:lysosomal thioesterase PPT2-like isoform X1 n=1 Tax=Sinocyclocheilus grahami TaxID=75366 RepID=UPI0007AC5CA0|nr:PREDICTED: lysosomal thioesterase PPT2-like isoform X1 [Sinocyclocheilus grahami]